VIRIHSYTPYDLFNDFNVSKDIVLQLSVMNYVISRAEEKKTEE